MKIRDSLKQIAQDTPKAKKPLPPNVNTAQIGIA